MKVSAYSTIARWTAAMLQFIAIANVFYLVAYIVYDIVEGTQKAPPLQVAIGLAVFSGVPWFAALLLGRALAATIDIQPLQLILSRRSSRFEVPLSSLKAIRPLGLPMPGPGLVLVMNSGRRFRYRLATDQPRELLSALAAVFDPARPALESPAVAYAEAKHRHASRGRRFVAMAIVKWVIVPLSLAVILFRLNQYIMFGGAFGQYYMHGLGSYLKSFALDWASTTSYLILYAGVVRVALEPLALVASWLAPSRASLVRRMVEAACQLAYFGLVPAFVAVRLLL